MTRPNLLLALALAVALWFIVTREDSAPLAPASGALHPTRIVPASTAALDWLSALVPAERLAAIPNLAEEYAVIARRPEGAAFLARPRFNEFESEAILAHAPDLVLVQAWNQPATRQRLVESGVRVVELPLASEFEALTAATRELGTLLGVEQAAERLTEDLAARRAALAERRRGKAPRVLVYTNYDTGSIGTVTGAGATMDLFVRLAGARNAAAERGLAQFADADLELLLALDPDVLVIARGDDGASTTRRYIERTPALRALRAVRDARIVELDGRLMQAASHHVLEAAEALAAGLEALGH